MSEPIDLYADRWLRSEPTYLTAMDRCRPQSALASDAAFRRWRVLPYHSDRLSGTAIVAGQETEAPPVRLSSDHYNMKREGWIGFLRRHGTTCLAWISEQGTLERKFDRLATALWSLLQQQVRTQDDARRIWEAVPSVLSRCNDQATYQLPGATQAYAWLHLLDRYARTWQALEKLTIAGCIPLARYGVNILDVGTGPGPSAFAIHDFYTSLL